LNDNDGKDDLDFFKVEVKETNNTPNEEEGNAQIRITTKERI